MAEQKSHSVVQCLTAIAQHHGLQVNPERLIEEHALSEDEPHIALLVAKVATANLAVGRCAKRANPAATRLLVEIVSTVMRGGPQVMA